MQAVVAAGLSFEVPSAWRVTHAPQEPCLDLEAPGVIVGSFSDVDGCYMQTSIRGPEVTLGSGGPPMPPIPLGPPEERTVNGVRALVVTADRGYGDESEFLALFPDRDAWLRVGVKDDDRSAALAAGERILATLASTDTDTAPPVETAGQSFIGEWHVHGARLEVRSEAATVSASCGGSCVETETLSVSFSPDGRRLTVVITDIDWADSSTGRPLANPSLGESSAVGKTSYFEFVAPHLMKETYLTSPWRDGYGNPYWCGEGLAEPLTRACGA